MNPTSLLISNNEAKSGYVKSIKLSKIKTRLNNRSRSIEYKSCGEIQSSRRQTVYYSFDNHSLSPSFETSYLLDISAETCEQNKQEQE